MKFIYQLIHKLFTSGKGGLVLESVGDGASPKFRNYRAEHGEEIFGYSPPSTLDRASALTKLPGYPNEFFPFQNSILSCVHATIAFLKGVYTNFEYFFTWRWTYGRVNHYQGGTRWKDSMKEAQDGMLLDKYLPQDRYWGGESKMQTLWKWTGIGWRKHKAQELADMIKSSGNMPLGKWEYIYTKDRTAIKHAIETKKVVAVGLYIQSGNWHRSGVIKWDSSKQGQFGHLIAFYDWDDHQNAWYVADWDGGGFRKLDYNYPLAFVAVVDDGKQAGVYDTMNRVVKTSDDPRYWVVWANNTRSHISSWELFVYGFARGFWVNNEKVEVLKQNDLDRIPVDQSDERLLNIMDEFVAEKNSQNQ